MDPTECCVERQAISFYSRIIISWNFSSRWFFFETFQSYKSFISFPIHKTGNKIEEKTGKVVSLRVFHLGLTRSCIPPH